MGCQKPTSLVWREGQQGTGQSCGVKARVRRGFEGQEGEVGAVVKCTRFSLGAVVSNGEFGLFSQSRVDCPHCNKAEVSLCSALDVVTCPAISSAFSTGRSWRPLDRMM